MKEKRNYLLYVLFSLLLVVGIVICVISFKFGQDVANNKDSGVVENKVTPLMYEVTKDGSDNKIYLFGSIHVGEEMTYPSYVENAYKDSDYLAVECNVLNELNNLFNGEVSEEKSNYYEDGSLLKDHLSKDTYNKLIKYLKDNDLYAEDLENYTVKAIIDLLELYAISFSNLDVFEGVDIHFLRKARNDGKTILEVESIEFQNELLNSFPERIYVIELDELVNDVRELKNGVMELFDAWKKGDPEIILKLSNEEPSLEDKEKYSKDDIDLISDYNKKMLDDRNIGMTDKFEEYFNSNKKVFFTVGAAHLVGEKGIANLLIQRGYNVVQVNK